MILYVATWNEYVSDCPADLEITSNDILGVYTTWQQAVTAVKQFRDHRIDEFAKEDMEDYALDGYFHIYSHKLNETLVRRWP